ncbi:hypothetical protein ACLOJK_015430 [Asimina triloba]
MKCKQTHFLSLLIARDDVLEFEKQVFKLGETLFGLISEALGLSTTYLQELGFMKPMLMGCNYYRPHPWPELFCPNEHADDVFLAIILQNHIGGLQVLHQQSWINVEPVRGALIVNIGKFLQDKMVLWKKFNERGRPLAHGNASPKHDSLCDGLSPAMVHWIRQRSMSWRIDIGLEREPHYSGNDLGSHGWKQPYNGCAKKLATNGKLKAVVHRVLAKRAGPRISLASFFHHLPAPKIDLHRMKGLICSEKPAKSNAQELIADEEPANCNA